MLRIHFLERSTMETVFFAVRNGGVEDSLARNTVVTNGVAARWVIGRIQRMTANAWNIDDVHIALHTRNHSPHYVFKVEDIHVFID